MARLSFPGEGLLLVPPDHRSAWSLACVLAKTPRQPHHENARREIREYLATRRGKTEEAIDEMTQLVAWAIGVINPVDGGTAESGGKVHQVVGDIDDLELALEIVEKRLPQAEFERLRDVILRHAD